MPRETKNKEDFPWWKYPKFKMYALIGAFLLVVFLVSKYYLIPLFEIGAAPSASPYTEDFSDLDDIDGGNTTATISGGQANLPTSEVAVQTTDTSDNLTDIAWTGSEYGVVWADNGDGDYEIYFAVFDENMNKKGSDVQITSAAGDDTNPAIVYAEGSSLYGIVWQNDGDGDDEIYLSVINTIGGVQGTLKVTDDADMDVNPDLTWNNADCFGVVWETGPADNNDIYFAIVNTSAVLVASDQVNNVGLNVDRNDASVAWDSDNSRYGIVWNDDRGVGGENNIYFVRFNSVGTKLEVFDTQLSSDENDALQADVTYNGTEYGVVWTDAKDGNPEIYFTRVDQDGAEVDSEVRVTNNANNSFLPKIITGTGASGYGIAWYDNRGGTWDVYFTRFIPGTGEQGDDTLVSNGTDAEMFPEIVFDSTNSYFSVVWADNRDGKTYTVYSTQVDTASSVRTFYATSAVLQSSTVDTEGSNITVATLTATSTLNNSIIGYYLSNDGAVTWEPVESGNQHVFNSTGSDLRWKGLMQTRDVMTTPVLSQIVIAYEANSSAPATPTLASPADAATDQALQTVLQFSTTDADSDPSRFVVQISDQSDFSSNVISYDQRQSQTGFSGQDALTNTAYASGTTATFTVSSGVLTTGVTFYWRVAAVDIDGRNEMSSFAAARSFTVIDDNATFTDGFLTTSKLNNVVNVNNDVSLQFTVPSDDVAAIADADNSADLPDLIYDGANYALVWDEGANGEVYFNYLDAAGAAQTSDVDVSVMAAADSGNASIVQDDSGYAVVWAEADKIYFNRVSAAYARVLSANVQVSTGGVESEPDLAWNGSEYGVVWTGTSAGGSEIYFARVNQSGYRVGDEVQITNDVAVSQTPAIYWNGSDYGIVWSDNRAGLYNIYFAEVDVTGTKLSADIKLTAADGSNGALRPDIVWDGSSYGIAWDYGNEGGGDTDIYFGFMSGVAALDSSFQVVNTATVAKSVSLTWNDTDGYYGLVWGDGAAGAEVIYFVELDKEAGILATPVAVSKNY